MSGRGFRLALLGWPARHSRSPAMHEAALGAAGLRGSYEVREVPPERLAEAVRALRAERFDGFNVTAPHKEAVLAHLDELEPAARRTGAVNTVVRLPDGRLRGANTDAEAVVPWLREAGLAPSAGMRAVLLGGGGAARAALWALSREGVRVTLVVRRPERARRMVADVRPPEPVDVLGIEAAARLRATLATAHVLVQASSATFGDGESAERFVGALPLEALPAHAVVGELVYQPVRTALVRAAVARSLRVADGLSFLRWQGAAAFERWTGRAAPHAAMARAIGEENPEQSGASTPRSTASR